MSLIASGVAFNILLTGVPFILLLASALGFLLGESVDRTTALVQQVIDQILPPHLGVEGSVLDPVLADVERTKVVFGISGALGFFWFAARLFGSLRAVINTVFEHGRDRTFFRGVAWDLQLSVMMVLLMSVWVVLNAWLTVSSGRIGVTLLSMGVRDDVLGGFTLLIGRVVSLGVFAMAFGALYRWLPKRRTPWIPTLAGALTAGLFFEVARWLFGVIVRTFPPGSIYTGTLGALIIVVFWTYYAALIFVLGAEVASATDEALAPSFPT